jgi:O-antigen/teichoic acid export membrane protein
VLLPRFSRLAADENGKDACRALLVRSMAWSAMLSYGLVVSAAACGRAFIERWVGPAFADAYPIMIVLMAGYAIALAQTPGLHYLRAANKHHFFAAAAIVEGLANLALSIVLVLRYGSIGVAIGTLVPMALAKTLVQPVYTARLAGMPLSQYWKAIGAPMPAAGVLTALALLYPLPTSASWLAVCAVGAGSYAAFVAITMFTVMSSAERRWAFDTVASILRLRTAASRSQG